MKRQLNGLIRLTRYKEYPFFVIFTTLLGAAAAKGTFGWKLAALLGANLLAVAFAFMINDVEDAPDDCLNPAKRKRNPVSAGDLSARNGRLAAFGVAIAAGLIYVFLGLWPLICGASCLGIAFFYSWRRVRLKSRPMADLVSHALMLAGLQFLCAYFTFQRVPFARWVFPFVFVVGISLYGEVFNEIRDLEGDRKASITHTASWIGRKAAYGLMLGLLLVAIGSGVYTLIVIRLIPLWVLLLWAAYAALLMIPGMLHLRRHASPVSLQESFHKPIEIAGAFALLLQFIGPPAATLLMTALARGG
jgi:4-hydroxybenzoate polyprenyltransferase